MKEIVSRKLIIDGNAVYEIDQECMLKKRLNVQETEETGNSSQRDAEMKNHTEKKDVR